MRKRIGLIGCGAVADYGHIPAIQDSEELELVSILDPCKETLACIREKYDIPQAFSKPDGFFASGLDAVSITSPAPCHKTNVLDAARHGLHVLCEKPLAMNGDEAKEMIVAVNEAGVTLYTAFCYRFSPVALKIRQLVRDRAVGDLRSLRLIYNWGMHGKYARAEDGKRYIQKRREGRMLEGGPMIDCGTHQIDLARFWTDSEVVDFSAHGAWVDEYEAPDHIWLHMDHANGTHTMVEISYSYHHTAKRPKSEFVYELIGTEGVIRYDRSAGTFLMENTSGTTEFEFHHEKSFPGLYAEWAKALDTGQSEILPSGEDGMKAVDIARNATEAVIYRSRWLADKDSNLD